MSDPALMKLVLDSGALSIWNEQTGPVFWGAAKVPMPFYINTELMIGKQLAGDLLDKITTIAASSSDPALRSIELKALLATIYQSVPDWQRIIEALALKAAADFPAGSYDAIAGGERRDWLFSIPLAHKLGLKHVYLFKDKSLFCDQGIAPGEKVLHVCDLINNAASHFDAWFPMLEKAELQCVGTIAVNCRGSNGMNRLNEANVKADVLNRIDVTFFEKLAANGLVTATKLAELTVFFKSYRDWGAQYLMGRENVFHAAKLDKKSFERMQSFFTQDPWELRAKHQAFFETMSATLSQAKPVA